MKGGSKGTPLYINVDKNLYIKKYEEEEDNIAKNGILL